MKTQIRRSIFETNSSSEHSLVVMDRDDFHRWINGDLLARLKTLQEDDNCWGNFWSHMLTLEFTDNFEQAKEDNEKIRIKCKENGIKEEDEYRDSCLSHKKLVTKILSKEEEDALSSEELEKYYDNLYEDSLYEFDEENYNYWQNIYNNLDWKNFTKYFGKLSSHCWMTYDEFIEELHVDCASPFEHDDPEHNIHIIGKYFHS